MHTLEELVLNIPGVLNNGSGKSGGEERDGSNDKELLHHV
jgi:hypothetical protein